MATKSISQLETAATVSNGDLYETAIPDVGSATGYASKKQSLAAIADHAATQILYTGLTTNAQSIIGAINEVAANANLAPQYDATATYIVGDIVIYSNALYKCITAVETPESFDASKWQQGTAADFFSGGGNDDILVTAGSSFDNYGNSSTDLDTICNIFLHAGETVVFVINHRSTLTLPAGVVLIHTTPGIGSSNQQLTFAKYTAAADEMKLFVFTTTASGRISLDYAVFKNVTIDYTGNFYAAEQTAVSAITAPAKTAGQILVWGMSAPTKLTSTTDGIKTTPADIYQISWPDSSDSNKVPRGGAFYDPGTGATNRTFSNVGAGGTSAMQIDAVEIIPN